MPAPVDTNQQAEIVLHLVPLPALADNYIWLLHDDDRQAIVVDPGDAKPVAVALRERHLSLRAILLTHHHHDHVGGVAELLVQYDVPVYAPCDERIDVATVRVKDGDTVTLLGAHTTFEVISVPGHTLSHVAYRGEGVLLCGDTLFSLGCGRLFEGSPAQMLASLERLASLPGETLVCCGHEYTAANGRFALSIEPDNTTLRRRLEEVAKLRIQNRPSVPSTLASELACNPFLRVHSTEVIDWCERNGAPNDPIARFAALRSAKDAFRA